MNAPSSSLFTYCTYQKVRWAKPGRRSTFTFFRFWRVKNCTVFVNTDLPQFPYLGEARYRSWSQLMTLLLEVYRGVPQCLDADVRIVGLLWSRPWPSPSIFILIVVLEWLSFLPFRILFSTLCPEFDNPEWFPWVPSPPTQFTIRSHNTTPRYRTYAFWKDHYIAFCGATPCSLGEMLCYTRQQSVYFIMHSYHMTFGRGVNNIAEKHCHTAKLYSINQQNALFLN